MKIRFLSFNIYLLLLAFFSRCQTDPHKKEFSTLRFHIETNSGGLDKSNAVPIYRAEPVSVNVVRIPFLDEGNISRAAIVESMGGFSIQIQFDRHGTFVLETVTAANKGRRVALYSQFGQKGRWLAAPIISQPITEGVFIFTPDASREEAERIVHGLNQIAKKLKKQTRV